MLDCTQYTRDDFATDAPYRAVLAIESPFERNLAIDAMTAAAKAVGVTNFKRLLKAFKEAQTPTTYYEDGITSFTGQPLELACGKWRCDDFGVARDGVYDEEVACPHPILPIERLVNVDTGEEKLRIAFSKGRRWRELIVPRKILASATKIVDLSESGIGVTSENARLLVRYFSDIENINYDRIPEKSSVGRLGYIEGEGFSPYIDGIVFDGGEDFKRLYASVQSKGSGKSWLAVATECRNMSLAAKIVLAASFASVLVQPLGGLPFFCHLWSGESGSGKTVALMLAASVWANPALGEYVQTFNGTSVGFEKVAEFLNALPYCIDELQLDRENRGGQKFNVYQLAQGVGRTRGSKSGGIQRTPTWCNCMITTGETPIVKDSDGAGALNRVIEIESSADDAVIQDGPRVVELLKRNYGHAGRAFVNRIYGDPKVMQQLQERYTCLFQELSHSDTTEKQAMAAALIITADECIARWYFHDAPITVKDIQTVLKRKSEVSVGKRGYAYMCDWVAQNSLRMQRGIESGEIFGLIEGDVAYIIRTVFNKAAQDGGYSPQVLLSYFKQRGLIEAPKAPQKGTTKMRRINGNPVHCVCLRLAYENNADEDDPELI